VVVLGIHDDAELRQDLGWVRAFKPLTAEELQALENRGPVYGPVT
jgi:hypothetical protein